LASQGGSQHLRRPTAGDVSGRRLKEKGGKGEAKYGGVGLKSNKRSYLKKEGATPCVFSQPDVRGKLRFGRMIKDSCA